MWKKFSLNWFSQFDGKICFTGFIFANRVPRNMFGNSFLRIIYQTNILRLYVFPNERFQEKFSRDIKKLNFCFYFAELIITS